MKEFGELKGYQGDIKGKALVDYTKWIMLTTETMEDMGNNLHSHDAGMIRQYHSDEVTKIIDEMEIKFDPFWKLYHELKNKLVEELELTDREKLLWENIWEFKNIDDDPNYTWTKYVDDFKKYSSVLKNLTEEDNKFIVFWVKGYE